MIRVSVCVGHPGSPWPSWDRRLISSHHFHQHIRLNEQSVAASGQWRDAPAPKFGPWYLYPPPSSPCPWINVADIPPIVVSTGSGPGHGNQVFNQLQQWRTRKLCAAGDALPPLPHHTSHLATSFITLYVTNTTATLKGRERGRGRGRELTIGWWEEFAFPLESFVLATTCHWFCQEVQCNLIAIVSHSPLCYYNSLSPDFYGRLCDCECPCMWLCLSDPSIDWPIQVFNARPSLFFMAS